MVMRHCLTSKRQSSLASRASNLSLGSVNLSPRDITHLDMEATSTSLSDQKNSSKTKQTSISSATAEFHQNPMAMRKLITSKDRPSSSSCASNPSLANFSSRIPHNSDTEATNYDSQIGSSLPVNPYEQAYKINKLAEYNIDDLLEAGILNKAKTAEELEIGMAKDYHDIIELFFNGIYYPAKLRNPKITNSWAIAHPDAPEIKALGISANMSRFNSQLEKSRKVKGLPFDFTFENPTLLDTEQQRAYMKKLVACLQ